MVFQGVSVFLRRWTLGFVCYACDSLPYPTLFKNRLFICFWDDVLLVSNLWTTVILQPQSPGATPTALPGLAGSWDSQEHSHLRASVLLASRALILSLWGSFPTSSQQTNVPDRQGPRLVVPVLPPTPFYFYAIHSTQQFAFCLLCFCDRDSSSPGWPQTLWGWPSTSDPLVSNSWIEDKACHPAFICSLPIACLFPTRQSLDRHPWLGNK